MQPHTSGSQHAVDLRLIIVCWDHGRHAWPAEPQPDHTAHHTAHQVLAQTANLKNCLPIDIHGSKNRGNERMGLMLRSSPSREARLRVKVQVSLTVVTHKSSPRCVLQSYYDLQLHASRSCMYKLTSIHSVLLAGARGRASAHVLSESRCETEPACHWHEHEE